jgi:hypothetical protein
LYAIFPTTLKRYLVPAFVLWHLVAIVEGAIPPPSQFNFPQRQFPTAAGGFVDTVTVGFDQAARLVRPVTSVFKRVTRPIHGVATRYRLLTGMGQNWNMFASPARWDRYMRVRYYVQATNGRLWAATELIGPAHREDQIRAFQSFRDSYLDKDLAISLTNFYNRRKNDLVRPDTRPGDLPNDLAPVARYFKRRFAKGLRVDEHIVRTEVWYGTAPTPALGRPADRVVLAERHSILQDYYEGAVEQRVNVPAFPPYHAGETEADIQWVLEYYEEP